MGFVARLKPRTTNEGGQGQAFRAYREPFAALGMTLPRLCEEYGRRSNLGGVRGEALACHYMLTLANNLGTDL